MTFAEEMHELAEQNSYSMEKFKRDIRLKIRKHAEDGDFHLSFYFDTDAQVDFIKRNKKQVKGFLKDNGFKYNVKIITICPYVSIRW